MSARKEVNEDAWIYTPAEFDPSKYPGPIAQHPDASRWLMNCIYFRHHVLNLDVDQYVNLHADLLGKIMSRTNYVRPIREALIAQGIIECDNKYLPGTKSLGYRLGPATSSWTWSRYYGLGAVFAKRIQAWKEEVNDPKGFSLPTHYHLAAWAKRITLSSSYREGIESIVSDSKRERATHQADNILRGHIYKSVCPYGRLHTNYSGLCRELRPHLRVDSSPLIEIDIVNSQPYFLATVLMELALSSKSKNTGSMVDLMFGQMSEREEEKKREERERAKAICLSFLLPQKYPLTSST